MSQPSDSPASAYLVVKRGGQQSQDIFPFIPPATIGRFDPSVGPIDVDLGNLPEGSYVSRKHARITQENGLWKIADLGSSNGTFVLRADFERVEEAELSSGDEIALGNARFLFFIGEPKEEDFADPAPETEAGAEDVAPDPEPDSAPEPNEP